MGRALFVIVSCWRASTPYIPSSRTRSPFASSPVKIGISRDFFVRFQGVDSVSVRRNTSKILQVELKFKFLMNFIYVNLVMFKISKFRAMAVLKI